MPYIALAQHRMGKSITLRPTEFWRPKVHLAETETSMHQTNEVCQNF